MMLLSCGVGEDSWESLGSKEMKPVNTKGNQYWILIVRTDAEAEAPVLCPLDVINWLIGKYLDSGKDWRQRGKGMTEDKVVEWRHQIKGHEFEQPPGVHDGQGCLECNSPWGLKEWDTTEWLTWTELILSQLDHYKPLKFILYLTRLILFVLSTAIRVELLRFKSYWTKLLWI